MIDTTLLHLAAVIATVAAAWAAARSAKAAQTSSAAANQTAVTAEQALKIGQRAWLAVTEIKINRRSPSPLPQWVTTTVTNTGQTPAMNVRTFQKWLVAADLPDELGYEDEDTPSAIGSIGSGVFASLLAELTYRNGEPLQIDDGGKRIFLYGRVRYNDVFGGDGETRWCSVYDPATQNFRWFTDHNSIA